MASEAEVFEHFSVYDIITRVRDMASEAEASELSCLFERMIRTNDMSLFFPFMLRLYALSTRRNSDDPDQESSSNEDSNRQRIILVSPSTQRIILINDVTSLEALFQEHGSTTENGQHPASTKSIETMKKVEIVEGEEDRECVVCLEEFEVGGVVKEMPCKHWFHGNCIDKWLRIHGSCPVCRYQMPIHEEQEK